MGSVAGKSLVRPPTDRSRDQDSWCETADTTISQSGQSGGSPNGCGPLTEEAEDARSAAGHGRRSGTRPLERANKARDLRMMPTDRALQIICDREPGPPLAPRPLSAIGVEP